MGIREEPTSLEETISRERLLSIKVRVLQNEYNQIRSHIQLLHRNSLVLGLIFVPILLAASEASANNLNTGYFIVFVPIIMASVGGLLIYIRAASMLYMDVCRKIERRINLLLRDTSIFDFESDQRAAFDKKVFFRWGPAKIMYSLSTVMFLLIYTFLSIRSCMFLAQRLESSDWRNIVVGGGALGYVVLALVLFVSFMKTRNIWKETIGWKAGME